MKFTAMVQSDGNSLYINVPSELGGGLAFVPVRGKLNEVAFTGQIVSIPCCQRAVIFSQDVQEALGITEGCLLKADLVAVRAGIGMPPVHRDLAAALSAHGVTLDELGKYEKRQLLSAINEAQTQQVRQDRIKFAIAACKMATTIQGGR